MRRRTNQKQSKVILAVFAVLTLAVVLILFGIRHFSETDSQSLTQTKEDASKEISDIKSGINKQKILIQEVERTVLERNKENEETLKGFEEDGWEIVETEEVPDRELVNLSPSLLGEREEELQVQIQSNSFAEKDFDRLFEITLRTSDEKTRYVALEALGRSSSAKAQELLMKAFGEIGDTETRSQILGYLLPASSNDTVAQFLTEQLNTKDLPLELKQQAAFPLAVMTIFGREDEDRIATELKTKMSGAWQSQFDDIIALLKSGGKRNNVDNRR